MLIMTKFLAASAGLAAIAGAAPAATQFSVPDRPQIAIDRCTGAVQNRLSLRAAQGDSAGGRVVGVTRVNYDGNRIEVRGLASSRGDAFGPYGVGAYGALAAGQADLTFECSVDSYGTVKELDIDDR